MEKLDNKLTDEALVKHLKGFSNGYAEVNGVKLHYVHGGTGKPLVLLPGWPETWWSYRKIMPQLAEKYNVIVVDLRGMGGSDKPAGGYDKKNMAKDIYELIRKLGYSKVIMAGHDIGSMVAFSFAANYPQETEKLIMMDIPHPDESWYKIPMIPAPGKITDKIDEDHAFQWWFAFHQVPGVTEDIMIGRVKYEQQWIFHYLLYNDNALTALDHAVYVRAYDTRDAIRAGYAWYRAFGQDIADSKTYKPLQMPVLGLGGPAFKRLEEFLKTFAPQATLVKIKGSGHFIPEEEPFQTVAEIMAFLN